MNVLHFAPQRPPALQRGSPNKIWCEYQSTLLDALRNKLVGNSNIIIIDDIDCLIGQQSIIHKARGMPSFLVRLLEHARRTNAYVVVSHTGTYDVFKRHGDYFNGIDTYSMSNVIVSIDADRGDSWELVNEVGKQLGFRINSRVIKNRVGKISEINLVFGWIT